MNSDAVHINSGLIKLLINEYSLSEKYTFEYLIALVSGYLEAPTEEGGCAHSCGMD